ncbi:MAG: class I SAM-dependent methyltransferase [Deltaproteobacteria bacterium]|nr:class I SAM-dependent methyltransferase [Deltaproteobacteria bacterium]
MVLHRKADTYWHIVESLRAYPGQEPVKRWLREVGFSKIELREQMGGIIAILSGIRP